MKKIRALIIYLILSAFLMAGAATARGESDESGIEERGQRYLQSIPPQAVGVYAMVARLATGGSADLAGLQPDLDFVDARLDCSDFIVAGLIRLLYLQGQNSRFDPAARAQVIKTLLNFKYWIDEPGHDSMCYWSENHQVLYHSAEYLAGHLFPDRVFSNTGRTGREHEEKGRQKLRRWFSWREKFGFSEWLSNVYYDEDLAALFNLADFAPDPEIRLRAVMAIDQLALNMALNSFQGVMSCTHGRSYGENNRTAAGDDVRQVMYIWWGRRPFSADLAQPSRSGLGLATSRYRLPAALYYLGAEDQASFENYQSHGVAIEDAPSFGLGYDRLENGMFFWGMGMYTHPLVADLSAQMWKEYDLFSNRFFFGLARAGVWADEKGFFDEFLAKARIASVGAYLDDARTLSYRTPHYILSSVLDRRPGEIGAQVVSWQAGLGGDAIVFTTHPAGVVGGSPGSWTGTASNPRVAQQKNVLVAIYHPSPRPYLGEYWRHDYTHAWFPSSAFDEVRRQGHWTFGRKGKGYLALYSSQPVGWAHRGPAKNELVAWGQNNIWICEMGSEDTDKSFDDFTARVAKAKVIVEGTWLVYNSPSRGELEFSWPGPFRVNGVSVPLRRDRRYDNPFVSAPRFAERLSVVAGGKRLVLDFAKCERITE